MKIIPIKILEINSNDFVDYRYLRIKLKKNIFNNIPLYFEYENVNNKEEISYQNHHMKFLSNLLMMKFIKIYL